MPKKVLLIATVQSHIGQFHKPLMRMLKEHGWEIHVAARDNLAEKNGLQLEYPDKVFDIPFRRSPFDPRNLKAYCMLKKLLREEHYDVIHCNTPVGGVIGRLAALPYRKRGTKVYYTAHGFHFYQGAPRKNWLIYYPIEKLMSRLTDKLIVINAEDYLLAKTRFSCEVYRIHGVGVDTDRFHPLDLEIQEKQKAELGLSGHILLNVGELLPNKNQKTAILALKDLLKTVPDAQLLIAGNGPERDNLLNLIETEGAQGHVMLLGYNPQIERYTQVCDVLVTCSYREGLGLNVIEAMLCGKPVVASNNRGHRDLIHEGANGCLVEADDAKMLAEKCGEIMQNELFCQDVIVESIEKYTMQSVQRELKDIYELE